MTGRLQNGIYYRREPHIGNSFCVIFLRASESSNAVDVGNMLDGLWLRLKELENGIIKELDVNPKTRSSGNLSILIGYGPKIFLLDGVKKTKPENFDNKWVFNEPNPKGGGPILDGSEISYADKLDSNHALFDHIIVQFIADTDFHTSRTLVETWKELRQLNNKMKPKTPLEVSAIYKGFQSETGRNLLGFHDGVSNIKSSERLNAIAIKPNNRNQDLWTVNGTYLAFMRTVINIQAWEDLSVERQEIIIGRDKETGCPLIGIDKGGKPVKDSGCPVFGTREVTDRGNEHYRERPQYGIKNISTVVSEKILQNSHIATTGFPNRIQGQIYIPNRIFRQGFEFLESSNSYPGFDLGLNFVSFQNNPESFFKSLIIRADKTRSDSKINKDNAMPSLNNFFSVYSAGVFFIPPIEIGEVFPGSSIFFSHDNHSRSTKYI